MVESLVVLLVLAILVAPAFAQAGTQPASSDMMLTHLRRQAHQALRARKALYEKVKTPEQITAWQDRTRKLLLEAIGEMPERTPLNAKVTGRLDRDGYRIEKVVFESRPSFFVTGLLYLPAGKPPHPAVLVPCGHSKNGKAYESYQKAPIVLARHGIAAFCFDPISQGERVQTFDEAGEPHRDSTLEHTLIGAGSILLGRNVAHFFVWDAMRTIDYLQGREDIDPNRIGCTGTSGGGTQTSYLMTLDPRIACAAPCCYLTSLEQLIDTIGPQDAEQNLHAQIACGLDHADYAIAMAPRPLLFGTATQDFFDIAGSWDGFRQAKRIYTRLGLAERVEIVEADLPHNFATELRVPMARWMRRWLCGTDEPVGEPEAELLSDDQCNCTPKGQVQWLPGARSVFDLNAEVEVQFAPQRRAFWRDTPKAQALRTVRQITGIRPMPELPEPSHRLIGTQPHDHASLSRLLIQVEPEIALPAMLFEPAAPTAAPCLYLDEAGKDAAIASGAIDALVKAGHPVLAVDLPGIGGLRRQGNGRWAEMLGPNSKEFFLAYMLGRSYLGIRTEATIACGRFLLRHLGSQAGRIHIVGIGEAGPAALHAAALESELFGSLELRRSLASWTSVVTTPLHRNQLSNAVHGALKVYDLPDLVAALPADKVRIVEPVDAAGRPIRQP